MSLKPMPHFLTLLLRNLCFNYGKKLIRNGAVTKTSRELKLRSKLSASRRLFRKRSRFRFMYSFSAKWIAATRCKSSCPPPAKPFNNFAKPRGTITKKSLLTRQKINFDLWLPLAIFWKSIPWQVGLIGYQPSRRAHVELLKVLKAGTCLANSN